MCPSHLKDMLPACFIVEAAWLYLLLLNIVFLQLSVWHPLEINPDRIQMWPGANMQWLALILALYHCCAIDTVTNMITFVINRFDFSFTRSSCSQRCFYFHYMEALIGFCI